MTGEAFSLVWNCECINLFGFEFSIAFLLVVNEIERATTDNVVNQLMWNLARNAS